MHRYAESFWHCTLSFKLLLFVQITRDDLMSIERLAPCEDEMVLMKEGLYPLSIKFVVNYMKLRSLEIPYEQKSNTVRLASESATYSPGISFEFSVYSLDSDMKNKSHLRVMRCLPVQKACFWVMIAWPYFRGKPIWKREETFISVLLYTIPLCICNILNHVMPSCSFFWSVELRSNLI